MVAIMLWVPLTGTFAVAGNKVINGLETMVTTALAFTLGFVTEVAVMVQVSGSGMLAGAV